MTKNNVFVDQRGMAWTLPTPPFPIKERWVSTIYEAIVKGWHGDEVTTRQLTCLYGQVYQVLKPPQRLPVATMLYPGSLPIVIPVGVWSSVCAWEPSVLLYEQSHVQTDTRPMTQRITDEEWQRWFPEGDRRFLSQRDQ